MPARSASQPASKADLEAVKSDLVAVKSELKGDIQHLSENLEAVRSDLKSDIKRLAMESVKTNGRMDDLERSLRKEIVQGTDRIMNAIDAFARKSEANDRAAVILEAVESKS